MQVTLRIENGQEQETKELNLEIHDKDILVIHVPRGFLKGGEASQLIEKFKRALESDSKVIVMSSELSLSVLRFLE